MKNYNDTIWNRARDLLPRSAVPQPTALPCTPDALSSSVKIPHTCLSNCTQINNCNKKLWEEFLIISFLSDVSTVLDMLL